jgi:hypothetical protein
MISALPYGIVPPVQIVPDPALIATPLQKRPL